MKLISKNGSFIRTKFISKGVVWKLISTESYETLMQTIDTFVNEKGEYQSATRGQLMKLCDEKKIKAID